MLFGFLLHTLSVPVAVADVGQVDSRGGWACGMGELSSGSPTAELWFLRFCADVQPLVAELCEQCSIREKTSDEREGVSLHATSAPTMTIEESDAFPGE